MISEKELSSIGIRLCEPGLGDTERALLEVGVLKRLISTIRELQERLADEWYCTECDEYTDDVTHEENHGVCGHPVKVVNTHIQELQAENERLEHTLKRIIIEKQKADTDDDGLSEFEALLEIESIAREALNAK